MQINLTLIKHNKNKGERNKMALMKTPFKEVIPSKNVSCNQRRCIYWILKALYYFIFSVPSFQCQFFLINLAFSCKLYYFAVCSCVSLSVFSATVKQKRLNIIIQLLNLICHQCLGHQFQKWQVLYPLAQDRS